MLVTSIISWSIKRQPTDILFNIEVEFIAATYIY